MATSSPARNTSHFPSALPASAEEKIRLRAYELFEKRGGENGRALDDWLQAESEIIRQSLTVVPSRPVNNRKVRAKKNNP
ncbi:MAG: DUF2934 domain-containing protein [Terriglobales bacterium]